MVERIIEIEWLLAIVLGAIFFALAWRRKAHREHPLFVSYVAYDSVSGLLIRTFRRQLFNVFIFSSKELIADALILGVAFGEANRIFRYYPGIRGSLNSLLVVLLLISMIYCFYIPGLFDSRTDFWNNLQLQLHPRLLSTAALLFLIITMGINFYNLKVSRADKLIILGFLIHLGPNALGFFYVDRYIESENVRNIVNVFYLGLYLVAQTLWISIYWPRHDLLNTPEHRRT